MNNKLVSVCINAYNAEKFILKTVNSAINQTYKNLQIIVVDDCSTDSTYDIIKSINDERVEVYQTPFNGHISFANNEALKYVKGDYVAHLDADDLWAEDKIEKQISFLEKNPEYGACFTHAEIIDENDNIADESQEYFRKIYEFENGSQAEIYRHFFDNANKLCHPSSLIKTEIIKMIGNHDASMLYLHDFDYWMRLLTFTPIYIIPERLTLVRRHSDNNSEMNEEKWNAHNTEFARLIYNSINICPDGLFLEAFKDRLKLQGEHTHEETELEKAFILLGGPLPLKSNPVLGLYKFSKLFEDENYIRLAREKFNFTTRDLYKIQTNQSYFDPAKNAELWATLNHVNNEKEHLTAINKSQEEAISNLNQVVEDLNTTISQQNTSIEELNALSESYQRNLLETQNILSQIQNSYLEIQSSFFWRLTSPLRTIMQGLKNTVSKNKTLLEIFIFLKGFLRGGISTGKERVAAYRNLVAKDETIKLKLAKKTIKEQRSYKFPQKVKFSILVPLYNTPTDFLKQMLTSVQNQTYENWELCLADGSDENHSYVQKMCLQLAARDKRIVYKKLTENKGISENTNECLKMATGDYIALFDHDDLLHPSALFEYMKVICEQGADFIYCDELTFTEEEGEFNIVLRHHKPEFSPDTLRSYNYICHFTCFSKKLYEMVGGFNSEYDGSQDYDFILRLTEKAKKIVRVPQLLYFWRSHKLSVASNISAKPYAIDSAERAIAAHLERIGLKGSVKESYAPTTYKIDYDLPEKPLISIIIPNKDHIDDLDKCISSIISKSTYDNFEIIVVENNSTEEKTFNYYEEIQKNNDKIKVVFWSEKVFNYSAINNYGAKHANGEYILLLNNDIEVITPNWLEEMLMFAQRKDVGAVGAKLYYPDDTVQHAGVILGIGGVAGHAHKYFQRNAYGYVSRACISQNLSACTAACLLMRKDVFDEVKGIDEGFAVAFNDVDLCMKIRKAGYLIVFTPYAEFYHYESKSRGFEDSPEKVARFNKEIDRFMEKWSNELEKGDPYYNPNLTLVREDFSLK